MEISIHNVVEIVSKTEKFETDKKVFYTRRIEIKIKNEAGVVNIYTITLFSDDNKNLIFWNTL